MNRLDRMLRDRDVWLRDNVEDIFRSDGEPLTVRCISDIGWNSGSGLKWYDFDTELERVSEEFAKEFPEEEPSGWPVVLHNHGAFVNIKYNVFELLHTADGFRYKGVPYDYGCRHFECIPGKIRALKSLFDELIKRRNTL